MKTSEEFTAVVIGSGFGGAVTACRLTEAGVDTCILERGRKYDRFDLPVLRDERHPETRAAEAAERKLPDLARAFWPLGQGLWDVRDLGDVVVGQAAGYGGGSLIYANVHLRAPDEVFADWPKDYDAKTLGKYYDLAAWMLDVRPAPMDLPKTTQLEAAASKLEKQFFRAFRPPLAVNFGPEEERENDFFKKQGACVMAGECLVGCPRHAKNTLDLNYLAAAEQQGAHVQTMAEVVSIRRLEGEKRNYEISYRNHLVGGRTEQVRADYVFLCAGAVNTTELLLRGREAGHLPIEGTGLGSGYHPNADELAVVFDCDEEQELDRGPTITSSLLYDDQKGNWLMVQDGGLPSHLEPLLGVFRSPLWLHRNGFQPDRGSSADDGKARRRSAGRSAAGPQRAAFADLPVDSLVDLLTGLTGSAITPNLSLAHDVSQSLLAFARGGRDLERLRSPEAAREWALYPDALKQALEQIRDSLIGDLAIASEPVVDSFLRSTAKQVPDGLIGVLRERFSAFDLGNVTERELREWGFRLAVQLVWGSQSGLTGDIATELAGSVAPEPKDVIRRAADLVRWALDYRLGDGHTALLLTFGRDSKPASLELDPDEPAAGSRVEGKESGATGVLVKACDGVLVLAEVCGSFRAGEPVHLDSRLVGFCGKGGEKALSVSAAGSAAVRKAAKRVGLHALPIDPFADDKRRFRTDGYRLGQHERDTPPIEPGATLRVRLPKLEETPERTTQELLLRDIAQALGGELRTNPLWSILGRRLTVHSQGGCPMAEDAKRGVTDPWGEVFGCPGLYVMDAAAFPSPVGVNPSATIAAVAERKIERFIDRHKQKGWTAETLVEAGKWADARRSELDPISTLRKQRRDAGLAPASEPPKHEPIGIVFREKMQGTHRPHEKDPPSDADPAIKTDLEVRVDDLARFLAQDREGVPPAARVCGTVEIDWGDGRSGTYKVDDAVSRMRILVRRRASVRETRRIEYELHFDVEGRTHVLDGVKQIRDDERFDIWEDTTTLRFFIGQGKQKVRWGVLRLPASEFFGGQLPSFEATGTGADPARQAWALAAFGRFFFGHLVDIYVPALNRVADLAANVARRDHA